MKVQSFKISGLRLIEPTIFGDNRGYFFESFHADKFAKAVEAPITFVQDNESSSKKGVLRGLHYQVSKPQGKLIRVVAGEIFDVAVDIRTDSPTCGQWIGEYLSAENKKQLWVPEGFAHGFMVISDTAVVQYKVTDYWYPEHERCIRFDDPTLAIAWPATHAAILSDKDRQGAAFQDAIP